MQSNGWGHFLWMVFQIAVPIFRPLLNKGKKHKMVSGGLVGSRTVSIVCYFFGRGRGGGGHLSRFTLNGGCGGS
jgi:hypothetical protein